MQRKKAFTLIELLVVIAIIAILAAILFPVFAQARESARTSSCASNEKQVSLGVLQYLQDYDERFPLPVYRLAPTDSALGKPDLPWAPAKNLYVGWDKMIFPYVKSVQVYRCVSAGDGSNATDTTDNNDTTTGAITYSLNRRLSDYWERGAGDTYRPKKLSVLSFPAVTIMVRETTGSAGTGANGDELGGWGWDNGHAEQLNGSNTQTPNTDWNDANSVPANDALKDKLCHVGDQKDRASWGSGVTALRRHKGGANYAFSDGHVKWYNGDASCVVWDQTKNRSGSAMTYFPN